MNQTPEYHFKLGNKEYTVKKSDTLLRRTYNLDVSRGFPWMTYTGNDRIAGDGCPKPALYSKPDNRGRQYLFSVGPWWVDANHSTPGYGYLSLVFLCLLRPEQIQNMCFDPSLSFPNINGMKIKGKIRGHNVDLKGADFVFWFQCYSEKIGKKVNYAFIGQPLNDEILDGNIRDFELDIDISATDNWVCLGTSIEKSYMYADLPIEMLDTVEPIDMGFILIPVDAKPVWSDEYGAASPLNLSLDSMWPIDAASLPHGAIAIHELEIDYDSYYQVLQGRSV